MNEEVREILFIIICKMKKTIIFSLRLTEEQYEFLNSVATKEGKSIGKVIRRLIDEAMRIKNI